MDRLAVSKFLTRKMSRSKPKRHRIRRPLFTLSLVLTVLLALTGRMAGRAAAETGQERTPAVRQLMLQAYRSYTGQGAPEDKARALKLYLRAAEMGDGEACFIVGGMLYRGLGTDPDPGLAFKYLLRAERQGKFTPRSLAIIGTLFLQGTGVVQNYEKARQYLARAAELGDMMAWKNLAYLYYNGLTGRVEYKKALELYRRAGIQGDSESQYNVGLMYANGLGTGVDRVRAYAWFSLAASQGNTSAVVARNGLLPRMGWNELNRAQSLALDLYDQVEKNRSQAGSAWPQDPDRP